MRAPLSPSGSRHCGVVGRALEPAGRRVGGVARRQHVEQDRRVAHRARHRAGGVLAVRDGQDPGAADEADGRLDRDEPVLRRRVEQRARGLGADRRRAQACGHRHRRTRARPAGRDHRHALGVEQRDIGVLHLAAQRRIARGHVDREDVGEFGEVGLAEDHRAGGAQPGDHGRVLLGARAFERERTGGGVLAVAGGDVVLDEDRDAGEREALRRLLAVAQFGDGERVGIDFAHRIERRAGAVIGLDALDIAAGQRGRCGAASRPAPAGGRRARRWRGPRLSSTV